MSNGAEKLTIIRKRIPEGKSVALIGGVFDLLHVGHLHALEYAKKIADILVVSVLSDQHVKSYKGEQRPIIPEDHRLKMVESLKVVDYAFISDGPSYGPENLAALKPDHLVFGKDEGDEARTKKVEAQKESIRSEFPDIHFHDLERYPDETVSTTAIIEKAQDHS